MMQLRLTLPGAVASFDDSEEQVVVRSEKDIRTAGFAAARSVRAWLRGMPFVPSTGDLHFNIYAEVVEDEKHTGVTFGEATKPPKKQKKKGRK